MRKTLILIGALALGIASCDKDDNKNIPVVDPNPVVNNDSSYTVNGLQDFSVKEIGDQEYELVVVNAGTAQEKISFHIEGMPDAAWYSFSNTGIPSFNTTLKIESQLAKPGTYPIRVIGTSASGKKRTYELNLNIEGGYEYGECRNFLLDLDYYNYDTWFCYEVIDGKDVPLEDKYYFYLQNLYLGNEGGADYHFTQWTTEVNPWYNFDCSNRTFTLQDKDYHTRDAANVTYQARNGKGSFNKDGFNFTYDVIVNGTTHHYKIHSNFTRLEDFYTN